jgi:cohesin loading factor subunit SCC2
MLFDNTNVAYTSYPTPPSSVSKSINGSQGQPTVHMSAPPPTKPKKTPAKEPKHYVDASPIQPPLQVATTVSPHLPVDNQLHLSNSQVQTINPMATLIETKTINPMSTLIDTKTINPMSTIIETKTINPMATIIETKTQDTTVPRITPAQHKTKSEIAVYVPALPTSAKEEYEPFPDSPNTPQTHSTTIKQRKRSVDAADEDVLSRRPDQREKAEADAKKLNDYLQDLFEAHDMFNPEAEVAANALLETADTSEVTLKSTSQIKVDSLISASITSSSFSQIVLDDLIRLQKLCEPALKAAESVDIRVEESWNDSDVEAWLVQLSVANLGLKAARTALRMMTGGRDDRQLYSEEVMQLSLNVVKNAMESCLIPVVELRSSGPTSGLFKLLLAQKKALSAALASAKKVLSLLIDLVSNLELSETVINLLEFMSSGLIFVENGHSEKDSVLGIQKFDAIRLVAMDVLSRIFLKYPLQRKGIINDILTSLEKLPVTRQSARQFKLVEGGSIQLVSALIMKLVQTCANRSDDVTRMSRGSNLARLTSDAGVEGETDEALLDARESSHYHINPHDTERSAGEQHYTAISELSTISAALRNDAKSNATQVITFIVERAMRSTKTGDTPYRNLLDLFVEDFITCLSSPDWPSSELLLRLLLYKMVDLAEKATTPAPAKNMALDLLGVMGAAISELNSNVRKTALTLENKDTGLGSQLSHLAESFFEGRSGIDELVDWNGPYRATVEFLIERSAVDKQLRSAIGYTITDWASQVCSSYEMINEQDEKQQQMLSEYGRTAWRLRMMVIDQDWLAAEGSFPRVETSHGRFAFALTLVNSPFCKSFERVLMILLRSMSSDQATVRSKSLKSVNQVLETDPTILDRGETIMRLILRCSDDASTQVRDSALGLIGKCIGLKPALEDKMIPGILLRFNDTSPAVRKRAMRLAKDIYLRNDNKDIRSSIADALLHRVDDLDESVQELARQTVEDVWMSPFYRPVTATEEVSVQFKLGMDGLIEQMIKTVQLPGVNGVLEKVLQNILSNASRNTAANFRVCRTIVATMFDTIIDGPAPDDHNRDESGPSARDSFQLLMIFAKASPKLFTADQVQLLQPYVASLKAEDDLITYQAVVVIFRHVLPQFSGVQYGFLVAVRNKLLPTIHRLKRSLLDDVLACLWIISVALNNFDNLSTFTASALTNIKAMSNINFHDPNQAKQIQKLAKLLLLCGMCGKHCDLDGQAATFRLKLPSWKGSSVARLMVDTFTPFSASSQPKDVRKAALDAMGMVCQSWPKNFTQPNVYTSFQDVFDEGNPILESMILRSFKEFLLQEEKRSEAGVENIPGAGADTPAALSVMGGSQGDGVASVIAQRFLPYIVKIAKATQDDHALLATEILASINRQGLTHPTECDHNLVALETSQNPKIAEIAFHEHRTLHEKHETLLEKGFMKGVHTAFMYQRDIVKDIRGATLDPYTSKLHLLVEVLKMSKLKSRRRFFERLCERVDFDVAKLDVSEAIPQHLQFSAFVIENLAFFTYMTIEELLATISAMERVVIATGTGVAQAIEEEIFNLRLSKSIDSTNQEHAPAEPVAYEPDATCLRLLTVASMILSGLWHARTYLRRAYGLMVNRREGKSKGKDKDLSKPPTRVQGVTGDGFWDEMTKLMASLSSTESMMGQCKAFVELLTVDKDYKVAAEDEDDVSRERFSTPSEDGDETSAPASGGGRGRKRKSSNTPGGRKKRARSNSRIRGKNRTASADSEGETEMF